MTYFHQRGRYFSDIKSNFDNEYISSAPLDFSYRMTYLLLYHRIIVDTLMCVYLLVIYVKNAVN